MRFFGSRQRDVTAAPATAGRTRCRRRRQRGRRRRLVASVPGRQHPPRIPKPFPTLSPAAPGRAVPTTTHAPHTETETKPAGEHKTAKLANRPGRPGRVHAFPGFVFPRSSSVHPAIPNPSFLPPRFGPARTPDPGHWSMMIAV
jgi:hypothetical protein